MSSVWYMGPATYRTISAAQWDDNGITGGSTTWEPDNGWSISEDDLTASQIAWLALEDDFLVGQADGPRVGGPTITPPESPWDTDVANAVNAEAGLRSAADDVLQGNINDLSDALTTEALSRGFADESLGTEIDNLSDDLQDEVDRATAAELLALKKASNLTDLADPAAARTALGLGSAALHAHTDYDLAGAAAAAQAAAATDATTKANAAQAAAAADATAKVAVETAARQTAINDLINGAPGTLDTLKEIADALADEDSAVGAIVDELATKAPLAAPALTGAATLNGVALETTTGAQTKANTARDAAIATAATDATTKADAAEANAISTAADDATAKVDAEATARGDADDDLQGAIDAEAATRAAADTTLTTAINTESAARTSADLLALKIANNLSDLNNPATARANLGLGTAAVLPSTTWDAAGTAQALINALVAGAPAALDTLNEIATRISSDEDTVSALIGTVATKAPLISPTFTPSATNAIAVIIKALAGQTGNLTEWQTSAGVLAARIGPEGKSMYLGADQALGGNAELILAGRARFRYDNGNIIVDDNGTAKTMTVQAGGGVSIGNAGAASVVCLKVKGSASQSGNLQEWQDSAGSVLAAITSSGNAIFPARLIQGASAFVASYGAFIRGLSASEVGLVVRGQASQSGDLQQWQDSAGTKQLYVDSQGRLFDSAGSYLFARTNVSAPANILISANTGAPILALKAVAGQTADQIQFHNSSGTVLGRVYSDGGTYFPYITGQVLSITSTSVGSVTAVIKAVASQTADLQQWQNSSGTVVASVVPLGFMYGAGFATTGYTGTSAYLAIASGAASAVVSVIKGAASQTGNLTEWQNSSATILARVDSSGNFDTTANLFVGSGASGFNAKGAFFTTASKTGLVVRMAASQTANAQEWQTSSGTVASKITPKGEWENNISAVAASDAGGGTGGIVLKSPDGTRYRITVSNLGTLTVTAA